MKHKKLPPKRRHVLWLCDKPKCGASNTREIEIGYVLVDDVCDTCKRRIHEPITEEIELPKD